MYPLYAPSETKFAPQAKPNLRPKRAKIYALSPKRTFAQQYMPETAQTSSREEHDQKEKTIHFPIFSYMFSITCDMLGASRPISGPFQPLRQYIRRHLPVQGRL